MPKIPRDGLNDVERNLRVLEKREPVRAHITLSPSIEPELIVVELRYGGLRVSVVVDEVSLIDLRPKEEPRVPLFPSASGETKGEVRE